MTPGRSPRSRSLALRSDAMRAWRRGDTEQAAANARRALALVDGVRGMEVDRRHAEDVLTWVTREAAPGAPRERAMDDGGR